VALGYRRPLDERIGGTTTAMPDPRPHEIGTPPARFRGWDSFPHDHARSRAYRWSEDGLAGICDDRQILCLALAFWNGRDAILKERICPQAEFPHRHLVEGNAHRGRMDPEYEVADTGVFDEGRYREITADYAKAAPEDVLLRVTVRNAGPDEAALDVLPTLWSNSKPKTGQIADWSGVPPGTGNSSGRFGEV
jgi:hypothetical protein